MIKKESHKTNRNLITCEVCGGKISSNAESCPHCGEPVKNITCKVCGEKISKNIESCPNCGEPVSSNVKSDDAVEDYVGIAGKSRLLSFMLTFFLGPLGLLYSNIVWGIIMIVIAVVLLPTGVGPILVWIVSVIMGDSMTLKYNEKLYAQAELMHSS